jgi:KaiC/GvpD/RAD55 family RecA-like ATPase
VLLKFDTYAEVSPSSTGIKLVLRGASFSPTGKKKTLPKEPSVASKAAGVEIYDRLRYFAVTGWKVKGPDEPQERPKALKWFEETYFPEQTGTPGGTFYGDDAVLERARKYLAKVPPAVSGSSGHNATFKAACMLVLGFGLSRDSSLTLLREYNATCQPPWSERELVHKIESAAKQSGPRNYLRNVPMEKLESVKIPEYAEVKSRAIPKREPRHVTMREAVQEYTRAVTAGTSELVPTGIPLLDYSLSGGLEWGELVVIAGRPSHGKSMIGLQLIHNMTALGHTSLLVLEESSPRAIGKRTLAYATNVPQEHWKTQMAEVERHYRDFADSRADCHIIEACRDADVVVEQIEKAIKQWGVKVVVIDYVQLLNSDGKGRYEDVTKTSVAIRQVTNEHNLITFAVCQLNRQIENRPKFVPKLSDLKESGQLEQDADVVVFAVWPYRLDTNRDANEYQLFIAKNKNREIKDHVIVCQFVPGRQMLVEKQASKIRVLNHREGDPVPVNGHEEFAAYSGSTEDF